MFGKKLCKARIASKKLGMLLETYFEGCFGGTFKNDSESKITP